MPPTSATGKALHYLHNEWPKLNRYMDDGRLEIDNNAAENANGLEPYAYLRYLFTELPRVKTVDAIEALLPGNLDEDQIRIS